MKKVRIIGAGLAGSEAALILAKNGYQVTIYEGRPHINTGAHKTDFPAELVCSNSFRSKNPHTGAGLLKEELKLLKSPLLEIAYKTEIKGGDSLTVSRSDFSLLVSNTLKENNIKIIREEIKEIKLNDDEITIIATGPLTTDILFNNINKLLNNDSYSFYDGTAPILDIDTINLNKCYFKNRYDKGIDKIYLNCPMEKDDYLKFYNKLLEYAKDSNINNFNLFPGCLPIEKMALQGRDTLRFGPLKPMGLDIDNKKFYAVMQLRQDDVYKKMYNIVGFQTGLSEPRQKELIRLIPGLEKVNFFKYGRLHMSKYINSPNVLEKNFKVKGFENLYIIGQITGIEGYIESIATANVAAIDILENNFSFSGDTIIGALEHYSRRKGKYLPTKANFGIISNVLEKMKKQEKREYIKNRSLDKIKEQLKCLKMIR